jgi:hypothetical protein
VAGSEQVWGTDVDREVAHVGAVRRRCRQCGRTATSFEKRFVMELGVPVVGLTNGSLVDAYAARCGRGADSLFLCEGCGRLQPHACQTRLVSVARILA